MVTAATGFIVTAFGAGTGAAIGAVLVNLVISSILGKILAPSVPKSGRDTKGMQTTIKSNVAPRRVAYGECITGGPYIYMETTGTDNNILRFMVAMTGHPIEDVLGVYLGDEYISTAEPENLPSPTTNDLDASYWVTSGKFGTGEAVNHVKIIKVLGWGYADNTYVTDATTFQKSIDDRTRSSVIDGLIGGSRWDQPSIATRDSGTGLTAATGEKVTNCSYVYFEFKYNTDVFTSFPSVRIHIKGKRLYNPAEDPAYVAEGANSAGTHDLNDGETWEYSENWALCCLDYLIHESYGLGAKTSGPLVEIDWTEMIQAISDAGELVSSGYPSPNIQLVPRYTINGIFEVNSNAISNMENLLTSGAGHLIYSQGQYKLRAGVYRPPASSLDIINEDMLASALQIRTQTPRSELFNKVSGVYVEKGGGTNPIFEPSDFPIVDPLDSSGLNPYEVIDGEEIIREVDFPFCIYEYEAQRIARIQLERVRQGLSISFDATLEVLKYSVGDTVYLEILSDSKYANEDFFNKLGLDAQVQNRPDSPMSIYYKQFKIVEMAYNNDFTISVVLLEESEELYDWNDGDANNIDYVLESELIVDDVNGIVLAPTWFVNSPYNTIEESTATQGGTTVTTLLRWSAAERGSTVNAIDRAHIYTYRVEYGIVTDPSAVAYADRVDTWILGLGMVADTTQVVQGPLPLETLYKDGSVYDFRLKAVTYRGRTSDWVYYSEEMSGDYDPTAPPASAGGNDSTTINYTNSSHTVPVTNLGVETWTGSGGIFTAYEGPTLLTLEQNAQSAVYPTTPGEYRLNITNISGDTLTEPAITGQTTTTATIADWAGNLTTATVYRISCYIFTSDSVQVLLSVDATISPSDEGADGTDGSDGITINYTNDSHTVPVTNLGVETWTGSGGLFHAYEGTTLLTLDQNAQSATYPSTPGEYRLDITKVSGDTLTEPAITGQTTTTATIADWAGSLTTATVYKISCYIFTSGSVQVLVETDATITPSNEGADGGDGDSVHVSTVYIRSATAPATPGTISPLDDGSYNFTTKVLTVPSGGWTTTVPDAPEDLYSSNATWSVNGTTGTDTATTWSTPAFISEGEATVGSLADFNLGSADTEAQYAGFIVDADGDIYTRQGAVGSTYSSAQTWIGNGANTDYECRLTKPITAEDSPDIDAGLGTWLLCSTDRKWEWSTANSSDDEFANVELEFRAVVNQRLLSKLFIEIDAEWL